MTGRTGFAAIVAATVCLGGAMSKPRAEDNAMKIVTFGTSLTAIGGWQEPLKTALAACLGSPVDVVIIAKSGSTSDWALANAASVVNERPDVVLVEFYANDAALNRWTRPSTSRANMRALFGTLRAGLPDARIVSMGMNPMHGMRGWMRPFLDTYTEAQREEGAKFGAGFVDFRPLWAARGDAWLAKAIPDGIHPTPEAAVSVMVQKLAEELSGGRCEARPPERPGNAQ